jgi:hypothetical protein
MHLLAKEKKLSPIYFSGSLFVDLAEHNNDNNLAQTNVLIDSLHMFRLAVTRHLGTPNVC